MKNPPAAAKPDPTPMLPAEKSPGADHGAFPIVGIGASALNMMEDAIAARDQAEQANAALRSEMDERKRTEERLRQSEAELKEAQRVGRLGSWDWDAPTDTITWSDEYYRIYGVDPKLKPPGYEEHPKIYTAENAARLDAAVKHAMQAGEGYQLDLEQVRADGTRGWITARGEVKRNADGRIVGLRGTAQDITERKRTEEARARLAMAVEHAAEVIVITDNEGVILYMNPAFEKTSGYTRAETLGQNPRLLKSGKHDAEFYRRMWAVLAAGQVWSGDMINKRKDGTFYEEDVNISPVRDAAGKIVNYVAVKRDITEQKKLEAQLRRTQRLESIGTLAGGIAHDLNNALAPIMMSAELLRLEFPDTASRYLELIQASTKRGADMVKQLLTFAKGIEGERLLLQPKHLLKEMEKLIQNTFLKEIELRTHYPKDLWTVLGDATQLHQVLLNLCVNARDAMPGGGTLTLEGENQELDAAYASTVPEAKPGRYVVWRVKDTGTGIPPEVLERIFDPFFTTKGPDKGTGLGLSTTMGIVKSHGGFIQVYSTPGQGSTFAVYLPAYGAGASDTVLLTKADTAFRGHGETILVVDDEDTVRNVLRAVLTKFNFRVLTAGDGADALLQVAEQQTELRVVITDLHMPNMDGLSFVRVIKGRLPGVGIIVVSGRMEEREENEFKQLGVHAVLQKPFTQAQLVEALKTVFQK